MVRNIFKNRVLHKNRNCLTWRYSPSHPDHLCWPGGLSSGNNCITCYIPYYILCGNTDIQNRQTFCCSFRHRCSGLRRLRFYSNRCSCKGRKRTYIHINLYRCPLGTHNDIFPYIYGKHYRNASRYSRGMDRHIRVCRCGWFCCCCIY